MLQNLKVDIIYYKTNTDFEMEFNLCGCCRMRLLTDKASDKKTLVHDLARAVSRSRVIIVAGDLSGEEGIVEITAKSIAKTVTEIDKNSYGIKAEEKIEVINGATPLVTPDGQFGGCVIESGPQSMILLSDDRAIRKTVMQTLIHPYIEELCTLEIKAKSHTAAETAALDAPPVSPIEEATEEAVDTIETQNCTDGETESVTAEETALNATEEETEETGQAEDIISDNKEPRSETDTDTEKPDGVTLEGGMIFETDGYQAHAAAFDEKDNSGLFIEPRRLKKSRSEIYNHSYVSDDDGNSPYHAPDNDGEKRKSVFSGNLPILVLSVLLLIVLAVLCYCIFYVPAKEGITASAYLSETFNTLFG